MITRVDDGAQSLCFCYSKVWLQILVREYHNFCVDHNHVGVATVVFSQAQVIISNKIKGKRGLWLKIKKQ